jgi:hypothetical protein
MANVTQCRAMAYRFPKSAQIGNKFASATPACGNSTCRWLHDLPNLGQSFEYFLPCGCDVRWIHDISDK